VNGDGFQHFPLAMWPHRYLDHSSRGLERRLKQPAEADDVGGQARGKFGCGLPAGPTATRDMIDGLVEAKYLRQYGLGMFVFSWIWVQVA
jgi:hypothetical protein